jgi:hypothetical protein
VDHGSFDDMNSSRKLLFTLCIIAIVGCTSTSSENVTTQGISADIDILANGDGRTVVDVKLQVGSGGLNPTSLRLGPNDSLVATANGVQQTLFEDSSIFGEYSYFTTFDFADDNTVITVAMNRASATSAPNSSVVLPEGFVISSPLITDVFGLGQSIPINWSPSGTSINPEVFVTLTCTLTGGLSMTGSRHINLSGDVGSTTVSVSSVMPFGTLDTNRLCDGKVTLSRWRSGNLDPNYGEGGQIDAEHARSAQFYVDPSQ